MPLFQCSGPSGSGTCQFPESWVLGFQAEQILLQEVIWVWQGPQATACHLQQSAWYNAVSPPSCWNNGYRELCIIRSAYWCSSYGIQAPGEVCCDLEHPAFQSLYLLPRSDLQPWKVLLLSPTLLLGRAGGQSATRFVGWRYSCLTCPSYLYSDSYVLIHGSRWNTSIWIQNTVRGRQSESGIASWSSWSGSHAVSNLHGDQTFQPSLDQPADGD